MNRKPKSSAGTSVLAERIVELRTLRELKQCHLAALAGVSARTMAALEQGTIRDPQITTLQKIADALQVSIDYLLGRPVYRIPSRPKVEGRESVTELYGQTA